MNRLLSQLRASAVACLLVAAGAASATAAAPVEQAIESLRSAYQRVVTPGERADLYRDLFGPVFQRVQRSYATEVDPAALAAEALKVMEPLPPGAGEPGEVFNKAVNAALRTLDAYSRYLDARAHGDDRTLSTNSFGGLGLEVEASGGLVRVVAPVPGSPAAKAGLQTGDLILRVDDQPLQGVPLADAIARMRGRPGTPVSLTLRRGGLEEEFTVSLTRDTIRRQTVRWTMEGDVLVLKMAVFSGPVSAALQQAINEASATHTPRAVVLDLRGNPGGLLREAVLTADTFLSRGDIVSVRGRTGHQRTWQADATELLAGVPMVVLIDRRSASASELVAAALQENGRATVMGQRSFGKGTVQTTFSLGEEVKGGLKLTTSFYHAPSGRAVQTSGVAPDIELLQPALPEAAGTPDSPLPVAAAPAPPMAQARVDTARCPAVYKASDPGLACAVAYLQAGDVQAFVARVMHAPH